MIKLVIPARYIQGAFNLKSGLGLSGLPRPENSGIENDVQRLAYTELFDRAEALQVPPVLGGALPMNPVAATKAQQAVRAAWDFLSPGPVKVTIAFEAELSTAKKSGK